MRHAGLAQRHVEFGARVRLVAGSTVVRTAQQRAGRRSSGGLMQAASQSSAADTTGRSSKRSRGCQFVRRRFGCGPAGERRPRDEHAVEHAAHLRSLASELRHDQGQSLVRPLLQPLRGPACGGFEFGVEIVAFDDVSVERPVLGHGRTHGDARARLEIRSTKAACAGVQRSKPTNSSGVSLAGGPTDQRGLGGVQPVALVQPPAEFDRPTARTTAPPGWRPRPGPGPGCGRHGAGPRNVAPRRPARTAAGPAAGPRRGGRSAPRRSGRGPCRANGLPSGPPARSRSNWRRSSSGHVTTSGVSQTRRSRAWQAASWRARRKWARRRVGATYVVPVCSSSSTTILLPLSFR